MASRSKKKRGRGQPKAAHPDAPWTEFVRSDTLRDQTGKSTPIDESKMGTYFRNNHYQVHVVGLTCPEPWGRVLWLSIKRNDRKAIHDWRDLQRIKSTIVGPEYEAVEIYPAESRLVDTSNQYHLWVFFDGLMLSFGYSERLVMDPPKSYDDLPFWLHVEQRPFRKDERAADTLSPQQVVERVANDPRLGARLNDDHQGEEE